jgi:hypothetical protein
MNLAVVDELAFMDRLMLAIGARDDLRVWRQNVGTVLRRNETGEKIGVFRAGPPKGAADISGIVRPEGWRLEIETKARAGRRSVEQLRWARFIAESGGVYVLASYTEHLGLERSVEHAVDAIERAIWQRRRVP